MIGIQTIGTYIPEKKISNLSNMDKFETDEFFIKEKVGISYLAIKEPDEDTSDMAVKAFRNLEKKVDVNLNEIQTVILITQNPDTNIPHSSALIHSKLNLPESCACFDVSLGCSGFEYRWERSL